MGNYNTDHQLIIKTFPFVLFEVGHNKAYCEYFIKGKPVFWYHRFSKKWKGHVYFSGTQNIKIFLEELHYWLKECYAQL